MTKQELKECREEFEKWASDSWKFPGAVKRLSDGLDGYSIMHIHLFWSAWKAAWSRRAVPEGWKLVPVEPTEEMITDGFIMTRYDEGYGSREAVYKAMIGAAPEPKRGA